MNTLTPTHTQRKIRFHIYSRKVIITKTQACTCTCAHKHTHTPTHTHPHTHTSHVVDWWGGSWELATAADRDQFLCLSAEAVSVGLTGRLLTAVFIYARALHYTTLHYTHITHYFTSTPSTQLEERKRKRKRERQKEKERGRNHILGL